MSKFQEYLESITSHKLAARSTGICTLPKLQDKIVTVVQKDNKGRKIYDLIYKKLNSDQAVQDKFGSIDGGDFEVYDLGNSYKVSIIDWDSEEYESKGTVNYKKEEI